MSKAVQKFNLEKQMIMKMNLIHLNMVKRSTPEVLLYGIKGLEFNNEQPGLQQK